jgi:hypothetical protein
MTSYLSGGGAGSCFSLGQDGAAFSDGTQTADKNSCESNVFKQLLIIRAD